MGGAATRVSKRNNASVVSPRFVGFNIAMFLTFAFGYLLLMLMFVFLGEMAVGGATTTAGTGMGMGGRMFGGGIPVMVFGLTIGLSPFIAMIGGLFTGIGTDGGLTAALTALAGGFLGFLFVALASLGLSIIVMGGPLSGNGLMFAGLVLLAIGLVTGLTGSISAAISSHYQ